MGSEDTEMKMVNHDCSIWRTFPFNIDIFARILIVDILNILYNQQPIADCETSRSIPRTIAL